MADDFFKPLNLDPKAVDMTDIIFKSAQLSLEKRERQRKAIQGVVDTFMTMAKLNQEKIRQDTENTRAEALLGLQREKFEFDKETERNKQNKPPAPQEPTTLISEDTGEVLRTFGPELGKIVKSSGMVTPQKQKDRDVEDQKTKALIDLSFAEVMTLA